MASDSGYVDYVAVLGLEPDFKPADVRRVYRKKIKDLLIEISQVQVTEERRNRFLLAIAQLNAAFYILRDKDRCEKYLAARAQVMQLMLEAGRDPECVENSNWDAAHERHASSVLRHYRQQLFHEIHERLPFYDITQPAVDWDERSRFVAAIIAGEGR